MKGVILAGGTGTRLHPLTRITNKHLLPIYDRPMVDYSIEALVDGRHHRADARHRRDARGRVPAPARQRARVRDRPALVRLPGAGGRDRRGARARGALRRRRADLRDARRQRARALAARRPWRTSAPRSAARGSCSRREDNPEHLRHLGVPELDDAAASCGSSRSPRTRRSRFAVTGIYFYDADVFDVIPTLEPSGRGELEITDVNNHYVAPGDDGVRRARGLLGRRRRVDRRVLRGQRLRARATASTASA